MSAIKVLVIDDSLTARMKIKETLESEGIEVLLATNGEEGEQLAIREQPRVILLDVVLPGIDGFTLCGRWSEIADLAEIPVLLISGERPEVEDRARGLHSGAMGYLVKPFSRLELLAQVYMLARLAETQRALRLQVEAANSANRTKSAFLATMSHEIRTPLTAILGFAEILLEAQLPDQSRLEAANIIFKNGRHLLRVLNDILDFSKLEAGKLEFEFAEHSVAEIFDSISTLMRPKAQDKGLQFSVIIEGPIPKAVLTDGTRLKQVLLNLTSNAIKFTESGWVRIAVSFDTSAAQLQIVVSDSGIGMSAEQLERLFNAFMQADNSITRRFGGTGLGLAITKQLIEGLGGSISVSSVEGKGTSMSILLPVDTAIAAAVAREPVLQIQHDLSPKTATPLPKKLRGGVLLAEDSEDNQRLISFYLKRLGLEVTIVENGEQAVNCALDKPFDLVLMDIQMPVLDGVSAAKLLRHQGYTAPIVALTAHLNPTEIDGYDSGIFDQFLVKPFKQDEFLKNVARFLTTDSRAAQTFPPIISDTIAEDPGTLEIILSFLDTLPGRIAEIENAITESQWEDVKRYSHKLMSAGLFGYEELTVVARTLEAATKRESRNDAIAVFSDLATIATRMCAGREMLIAQAHEALSKK